MEDLGGKGWGRGLIEITVLFYGLVMIMMHGDYVQYSTKGYRSLGGGHS